MSIQDYFSEEMGYEELANDETLKEVTKKWEEEALQEIQQILDDEELDGEGDWDV